MGDIRELHSWNGHAEGFDGQFVVVVQLGRNADQQPTCANGDQRAGS
jgi:hypothetical protein